MLLFVKCYVVFHCLMFYFQQVLVRELPPFFGKKLPALLDICSFCGCLVVFFCLFLWCWRLDVDLTISVPEFTYSLCLK